MHFATGGLNHVEERLNLTLAPIQTNYNHMSWLINSYPTRKCCMQSTPLHKTLYLTCSYLNHGEWYAIADFYLYFLNGDVVMSFGDVRFTYRDVY